MSAHARDLDLKAVPFAWPTFTLFILVMLGWASALYFGATGMIPAAAAFAIGLASTFASFTAMHDASHKAIARIGWVNAVIGRLCSVVLIAPYGAFRYMHLEHHKHTNDPEKDPDIASITGSAYTRPLHWVIQDMHLYSFYLRRWSAREVSERVDVLLNVAACAAIIATFVFYDLTMPMLYFWVIPARISITLLAWCFAYLPHRKYAPPEIEERFRVTYNIKGRWLTLPLLYQNYHLIHHLYPGVPFYRYARVWNAQKDELLARGAQVVPVFLPRRNFS